MSTITAIRRMRKGSPRLAVFVDGKREMVVPEDVVVELGLRSGIELDAEMLSRIAACADRVQAREAALGLLAVRARSMNELKSRLRRKGVAGEVADDVLIDLTEAGLVDDLEFARLWASERASLRPVGRRRLIHELRGKGVTVDVANEVADELYSAESELDFARRAAKKKAATLENREWCKARSTLYSFLLRRGFAYEVASQVLKELENNRNG